MYIYVCYNATQTVSIRWIKVSWILFCLKTRSNYCRKPDFNPQALWEYRQCFGRIFLYVVRLYKLLCCHVFVKSVSFDPTFDNSDNFLEVKPPTFCLFISCNRLFWSPLYLYWERGFSLLYSSFELLAKSLAEFLSSSSNHSGPFWFSLCSGYFGLLYYLA